MLNDLPLIFSLNNCQAYANRVAQHLDCSLAAHEERTFEDGEHKFRALEPVTGRRVLVFHSLYGDAIHSINDKLCQLLFFCGSLKDAGASHVAAVTPYLCYSRKERRTKPQDPITSRYVASLFEACGVDRLISMDVHNIAAFENAFRIPTVQLPSAELFAAHFSSLAIVSDVVAVSPDAGGVKRAEQFRQALQRSSGRPVSSAYVEKYRSNDELSGGLLIGEVCGKTAIIVDDLISTGSTLLRAGNACQAAGAGAIFAAATHGLFLGGSDLINSPLFRSITISDSVPPFHLQPEVAAWRLEILDSSSQMAALLAQEYGLEEQLNSRQSLSDSKELN